MIVAKYDGIDAESASERYAGWIEATDFAWAALPVDDGRLRRGAEAEAFTLTFPYEKAAPELENHAFTRRIIPRLQVEVASEGPDGPRTYLRYAFTDVVISDFSVHCGATEARPIFTVGNTFQSAEVSYIEYDQHGAPHARTGYTYRGPRP